MKTPALVLCVLALVCLRLAADPLHVDEPITPADPVAAGQELAARLLSLQPAESATNEATLFVRVNRTNRFEVELRIEVRVNETNWSTTYSTCRGTNPLATHTLTITRDEEGRPHYELRRDIGDLTESKELTGAEIMTSFAGSDFWAADFGMEYLRWPAQRLLRKELCRGQSCDKLESLSPPGQTNGYVRVVSWFDIDTGGPVLVEAYDAEGRQVKEFKPNNFKKVNGRWEVEEMEITNRRTGSHTTLRFKLNPR